VLSRASGRTGCGARDSLEAARGPARLGSAHLPQCPPCRKRVQEVSLAALPSGNPVAIGYRVSWPDQCCSWCVAGDGLPPAGAPIDPHHAVTWSARRLHPHQARAKLYSASPRTQSVSPRRRQACSFNTLTFIASSVHTLNVGGGSGFTGSQLTGPQLTGSVWRMPMARQLTRRKAQGAPGRGAGLRGVLPARPLRRWR